MNLNPWSGGQGFGVGISSGQTALPLKVGRRSLLHGGFVCESRYFRLDYKTQNVPSLQVRAVMEKCNRFFFFWVGFAGLPRKFSGPSTHARPGQELALGLSGRVFALEAIPGSL